MQNIMGYHVNLDLLVPVLDDAVSLCVGVVMMSEWVRKARSVLQQSTKCLQTQHR